MKKAFLTTFILVLLAVFCAAGSAMAAKSTAVWPDNEYTRQVPQPPFAVKKIGEVAAAGLFHINFQEAAVDAVDAYIQTLKAHGFTIGEKLSKNSNADGTKTVIQFDANNPEGWAVSVRYMGSNAVSMTIVKPKK